MNPAPTRNGLVFLVTFTPAFGGTRVFPNHYSGEGALATKELGEFEMNAWINAIATAIRAVQADDQSLRLQNEFYEKSKHPLDTRP